MSTRVAGGEAGVNPALQGGKGGDGNSRGVLERKIGRLGAQSGFRRTGVLGEGAFAGAENVVARAEACHGGSSGFDGAGDVSAEARVLGRQQASHETKEIGLAAEEMPVVGIDRCGANAEEDFVGGGRRGWGFFKLEDSRRAVAMVAVGAHLAWCGE